MPFMLNRIMRDSPRTVWLIRRVASATRCWRFRPTAPACRCGFFPILSFAISVVLREQSTHATARTSEPAILSFLQVPPACREMHLDVLLRPLPASYTCEAAQRLMLCCDFAVRNLLLQGIISLSALSKMSQLRSRNHMTVIVTGAHQHHNLHIQWFF